MAPDYQGLLRLLPKSHIQSVTPLGLSLSPNLDPADWYTLTARLAQLSGRVSRGKDTLTAWLGDLLAYGSVKKYRGQITEYAQLAGLDPGTLRNAKLVCTRIPASWRHDALSWAHHCEIGLAFDKPDDIRRWLDLAAKETLSSRELRRRIRLHLAERSPPPTKPAAGACAIAPFTFLRELRAVGRFVQNNPDVWTEWPPETCCLALTELEPLTKFVDHLRARSAFEARARFPLAG